MAGRRKRTLSGAERADWDHVTRSVAAYRQTTDPAPARVSRPEPVTPTYSTTPPRAQTAIPQDFAVSARAKSAPPTQTRRAPDIAETLGAATPRVDGKRHALMKRGKIKPDSRIDLHGMTLAQAQPALAQFLWRAHGRGHRLVLVITGKGRQPGLYDDRPVPQGQLRRQVPDWVRAPHLAPIILQITPAHHRHGGDGAYYIALRRKR